MRSEKDNYSELEQQTLGEEPVVMNALRKTEHFKISRRDTLVNDLKNSTTEGLISFGLSLVSLFIVIASIIVSYRQQGNSRALIGLMPLFSLIISIGALIFAILGFRRKDKVRHYMEKRGLVISLITISILIAVFIRGLIKVLQA